MASSVRTQIEKTTLLMVPLAAPDPNPALPSAGPRSIFPYTRLYRFGARPAAREVTSIRLENDFLDLQILPELGGHLWSAVNKKNGQDLLHHPEHIGLINFGLRGAWYTGGIEFNFPNSHSVTTPAAVPAIVRQNPGGSASVIVGNLDLVWRVGWSVGVRLEPDSSSIHFDILLYNCTPLPVRYWWWMNAGVPADPSLEYVNSTTEVLPHFVGRREHLGEKVSWPIWEGHDLRGYGEYVQPTSLFHLAGDDRWFGFYHHGSDQGLVRIGSSADAPGLKFWNSGQSEEGYLWGKIMTAGERYANTELQSGRPETQTDYGVLPPHHVFRWTESWRPVWGLGGVTCASEAVAISLAEKDGRTVLSLLSNGPYSGCTIRVVGPSESTLKADLSPQDPLRFDLPFPASAEPLAITVTDAEGRSLLDYNRPADRNRRSVLADVLQLRETPLRRPDDLGAEELALEAERLERFNLPAPARVLAAKALGKDPGQMAAHLLLAWRDLREGRYDEARGHCRAILWRNPRHEYAHFALALSYLFAGDSRQAEIEMERVAGQGYATNAAAWFHLGELRLARRDYRGAVLAFDKCLVHEGNHVKAMALKAVSLSKDGQRGEASWLVTLLTQLAPLDPLVRAVRTVLRSEERESPIDSRSAEERTQDALEAACDFLACGLLDEALGVLERALRAVGDETDKSLNPLAHYYLGYVRLMAGDSKGAGAEWEQAAGHSGEYVYSFRREDREVLQAVLLHNPEDGLAHYLLGMLETYCRNPDRAEPQLLEAVRLRPTWDQPWRLLALARTLKGETLGAVEAFRQAIALRPDNWGSWAELDTLLQDYGMESERARLWADCPAVPDDDAARGRYADYLIQSGDYTRALELLENHVFFPLEGNDFYRDLFVQAHLFLALHAMEQNDLAAALEHAQRAQNYPENLGLARPFICYDAPALVLEAAIHSRRGEAARLLLERAAAERHRELNEAEYFAALAARALGREEEADGRLRRLLAKAEHDLAWPDRDQAFAAFLQALAYAGLSRAPAPHSVLSAYPRYGRRLALCARIAGLAQA